MEYLKKEFNIDKTYKIKGYSRGSLRTGFILYPCKIFLDAGIPVNIKPNVILITHGHQDHIDSLYNHLLDTENVQVIGCNNLINNLQGYLSACRTLNAGFKIDYNNWNPTVIIDNLIININNIKYFIEGIKLDHEVECIGYGISEIRNKLKDEYINCTKKEIETLKKSTEITFEYNYPILFFCGDTNYTSLDILPFDKYPVFIIECTFFLSEHIKEARYKKHLHINDLILIFNKYINTKFILIHFSCRYDKKQLNEFKNIYNFPNVIFWI